MLTEYLTRRALWRTMGLTLEAAVRAWDEETMAQMTSVMAVHAEYLEAQQEAATRTARGK